MSQQIQGQTPGNGVSCLCNNKEPVGFKLSELYNDECEAEPVCLSAEIIALVALQRAKGGPALFC